VDAVLDNEDCRDGEGKKISTFSGNLKATESISANHDAVTILDLPEEMILRIISFLCKEDALWRLGSVCKRFLRLSLLSVKIIGISFKIYFFKKNLNFISI
jgi:hypothetical protein